MTEQVQVEDNRPPETSKQMSIGKFLITIPFYVAVPFLIAYVSMKAGYGLQAKPFIIGLLAWFIALVMRGPVAQFTKNLPREKQNMWITSSSGPLEEILRLIVLLVSSRAFSYALWLGQGWAAIEVLLAIVQGIAIIQLMKRTDEKSREAQEILRQQGNVPNLSSAFAGVIERIFASAYHIGATLVIAANPWLTILMVPVHSLFNIAIVRTMKKSVFWTEVIVVVVGTVVLLAGLALHGRL